MNCSQLGVRILITALQRQQARQSREVQNISGIWRRGARANQRAGAESAGLLSSTSSIHRSLLLLSSSPPFLPLLLSLSQSTYHPISQCVFSIIYYSFRAGQRLLFATTPPPLPRPLLPLSPPLLQELSVAGSTPWKVLLGARLSC